MCGFYPRRKTVPELEHPRLTQSRQTTLQVAFRPIAAADRSRPPTLYSREKDERAMPPFGDARHKSTVVLCTQGTPRRTEAG